MKHCDDNDFFTRAITFSLQIGFLLLLCAGAAVAQDITDLDGDGVPDHLDVDTDNDGLTDTQEGYRLIEKAAVAQAPYYLFQHGTFELLDDGRETRSRLLSTEGDAWLHGAFRAERAALLWMELEDGVKLQSSEPATQFVEWVLLQSEQPIAMNADVTISDLDPERRESVVVGTDAIVGYSLPGDSSISVEQEGSRLTFIATPSANSGPTAIILHVRDTSSLLLGYEYLRSDDVSVGGRAGFKHVFSRTSLSGYTAVVHESDSDGDTVPDHKDSDSDNDGVPDVVAAGYLADALQLQGIEIEPDGQPVFPPEATEPPNTEAEQPVALPVVGTTEPDQDGDGLSDLQEQHLRTDHRLVDTDDDGYSDMEEVVIYHTDPTDSASSPAMVDDAPVDSDKDGIADSLESLDDQDEDGIPDRYDLDSDNDGIADIVEAGLSDTDADGLIDDHHESIMVNAAQLPDTDGDLVPDLLDLDSDGDGYFDRIEAGEVDVDGNGSVDAMIDANSNGWDDFAENNSGLPDQDRDGKPDYLDTDIYPAGALLLQDELPADISNNAGLKTGVKGSGCVLNPQGTDFSLLLLLLLAVTIHYSRHTSDG